MGQSIKFEIENPDIRPEFEAIREYFTKILKKKLIIVEIEIHYTDNQILSSAATSDDINKINSGIIDSVRFEFVKRHILSWKGDKDGKQMLTTLGNLFPSNQTELQKVFKSEANLIDDILNVKSSKHYHHLKYLASHHLSSVLKIRFILNPFSFLFLLSGERKYHVVWETLNSEEATYIWHFEKSLEALRKGLNDIEIMLTEIKRIGKQDYLKKDQLNFSRVMHDYSDAKQGFTIWKGQLEEKLT